MKGLKIKLIVAIVSAVLLLGVGVGGTIAYITARSGEVTNTMKEPLLRFELMQSSTEEGAHTDVAVKNTGDTPIYVRASILVNAVASNGSVLAVSPVIGTDYTVSFGDANWVQGSDGFYYYTRVLKAGEETPVLIERFESLGTTPDGYTLELRVLTSAIQAAPEKAVTESWGATVSGEMLTPP